MASSQPVKRNRPSRAKNSTTQTRSSRKLNEDVRKKLVTAIQAGNHVAVAARFAGIHPSTFWSWMRKGSRSKRGTYREFYLEIKSAETYAEMIAVASIHKHMKENWRAAVAYLERKFPKRWSSGGRRAGSPTKTKRGQPVAVRLKHDAAFLGEVAHILDQSGAIESVLGNEALTSTD